MEGLTDYKTNRKYLLIIRKPQTLKKKRLSQNPANMTFSHMEKQTTYSTTLEGLIAKAI